jgi:hypothetical protein
MDLDDETGTQARFKGVSPRRRLGTDEKAVCRLRDALQT